MEEIILRRLFKFIEEVRSLSDQARNICNILNNENLESAKVLSAKLKSILSRFTSELYNYFNISKNPDPDEISNLTTHQLQGEEILAELDARLKMKTEHHPTSSKEREPSAYSKLPDLSLPEFSGDLLQWHQFWDQFTSNINRRKLNDVDKLLYLKSSLKGDAARLIDGFDTTNRSYQIAVDTLKARYGKENEIIYAHHKALSKVERAVKIEDCRVTLDEIERHLRILQSMGENTSSNQMRFLIMEKFPTELIYEIKMRIGSNGSESVEDILKQLALVISTKEEARRITQGNTTNDASQYTVETLHVKETTHHNKGEYSKNNNSNNMKHRKQWNNPKPRTNNWNWNSKQKSRPLKRKFEPNLRTRNGKSEGEKRKRWSCAFCEGNHDSKDCDKFKSIYERKAQLKSKNKCFNCFKSGHFLRDCLLKRFCDICGKHGSHNKALCLSNVQNKKGKESNSTRTNAMNAQIKGKGFTVLQTAVVTVKGHGNIAKTCRVLLDCGSQRSYITQSIARELNLQVEEQNNLAIFTFGSQSPKEIQSPLVKLGILTRNNTVRTLFVNVVPSISQGVSYPDDELSDWKAKESYPLADDGSLSDRVDILLGNDYYYTIMSTKKICIREDLYLVESELGWILSGRISNKPVEQMSVVTYFQSSCEIGLNHPDPPLDHGNVKLLWDLESIGITDSPKINRDEEAIKHFNETTEYKDNRYYVSWPWNDHSKELPSNFGLAFGRLVNLLKRLDADTLRSYEKTLKEQLERGIIEEVPKGKTVDHPIHYIPHHGVSVPGKALRIVYDASAKTKEKRSLNEHLYRGPILLEDLTGLIVKFRCYTIGLTADVEKAFLQIGLKEQDRDVTRFLWVKDLKEPATEDNLVHFRFTRVPFGIISSPFLLNATVKHHLAKAEHETVRKLSNDIYVDNVVTGTNGIEEALDLYRNSKETFQQISMNLRQWSSNSEDFMQQIPDACPDKVVKLLGLNWNLEEDTLHLRAKIEKGAKTKRGVLKVIASVYDPCGYAVPYILSAKLFLQDLWKDKVKWDSPLSKDLADKWSEIQQELDDINKISVNRCYMKNEEENEYELHCFVDASMKAYAASVFIVHGTNKSFVMGKSRLVPIKDKEHLKIPRLELMGVLIGSRLIKYVLKFLTHKITKQILWTDSQIVIEWCKTDKLLPPFITRRIEEIKTNQTFDIRYVPSELNPADVGTRPSSSREEKVKRLMGPQFLIEDPKTWPCKVNTYSFSAGEGLSNTENLHNESSDSEKMDSDENCQDLNRSEIVTTELDRIIIPNSTDTNTNETPQVQDIRDIEVQSYPEDNSLEEVKKVQAEYFKDELNGKVTSLCRNLGLFKDIDGVLRCKGRLKNADWSFDKRYPMIIPKECDFTNKVIMNTHERNYHVGVGHTLSIIRQIYWIPQGRRQVQRILSKCPRCVKHGGGPFKLPPTPALPHERVNFSKPFTFTGVDYLGPVLVKTERGTSKRWICLFTCLAVRAVHLEVVEDLTAEEGLLALRRMISTKGVPTLITSDNALHFKLIADIVSNAYCVENKIKLRFIPELAPWFGGFYERLVGLVKHCMRRTLQKHLLKDSQLSTIIKEIEAVINTRPLTCVDSELEHILTPSDFLQTGRCVTLETANKDLMLQGTSTKTNLIKGWRKARVLLEEFKEMFCNRYLPSLRERYNNSHKQPRVISNLIPKEGQIVQIKGDKNREGWKVGKIISLVKGSDDLVRVAQVKVGDTIFTRSIAHLYPLEVEENEQENPVIQNFREHFTIQKLPDTSETTKTTETTEASQVMPDVVMERSDDIQREVLTENDTEKVEDMDMIDKIVDVTINETGICESTDRVQDDSNVMDTDLENEETVEEQSEENKHKRVAAVRALEKIREWTRNLMITLL